MALAHGGRRWIRHHPGNAALRVRAVAAGGQAAGPGAGLRRPVDHFTGQPRRSHGRNQDTGPGRRFPAPLGFRLLGRRGVPLRPGCQAVSVAARCGPARMPGEPGAAVLGSGRDERGGDSRHRRLQRVRPGDCCGGAEHALWSHLDRQGGAGAAAPLPGRAEPGVGATTVADRQ